MLFGIMLKLAAGARIRTWYGVRLSACAGTTPEILALASQLTPGWNWPPVTC